MGKLSGKKQETQQRLAQLQCRVMERVLDNSGDIEIVYKALKCYHVSSVIVRGN